MADLAKLVVKLEADSSRLASALEKSEKRAKRWEKKATSSVNAVKKSFLALGSAVTAGLFIRLVKDSITAADRIGKVSDAVALTTTEYQKLAFAADIGGVAQSQFNSNMTAFVKRVGEARANTGPLVSFLKKYDEVLLQAIKNTRNQSEAFDLIANAIKNAKTETDQAAIANAAFSRAGVSMVNVMRDGSAGLDAMRDKASKLGIVLDEQTVRNAEKANDQLTIMATVIKNNVIKQVVALSPQIIAIGEAFADALPKLTLFIEKFTGVESTGTLTERLEELNAEAARTFEQLGKVQESGDSFLTRYMFGSQSELQERLEERYQAIAEVTTRLSELQTFSIETAKAANDDNHANLIQAEIEHAESLRKIYEKSAKERVKTEKWTSDTITSMHRNVWQEAGNFLRVFAGESKTAAIAVIAINKALSIAQAIQNTAVAVTKALTIDPTGSLAARVQTLGSIQIGLIGATGIAEISQLGGGGAPPGSPANPVSTQEETTVTPTQPSNVVNISISGNPTGEQVRELIDQINEQVGDGAELKATVIA